MNTRTTIQTLLLLATASLPLCAQPVVEPITQNPDAVLLRRIWTITGNDGDRVGQGCGPVGDINGDSITDFAVQYGIEQRWKVFLGGSPAPSPVPVASIPSLAPYPAFPVYGHFYGDNRLLVGFGSHTFKSMNGTSIGFYQLKLYQPDVEHGLSKEPVMILEPDPDMSVPLLLIAPSAAIALNIDDQRGDELLLALSAVRRGDSVYKRPEYWFYRGGESFQVDTPDYVVRDPEEATDAQFYTANLLDLDGDRYVDLLSVAKYAEGFKLKMWFGTETTPWTWTQPDREILLTSESGISFFISIGLFDGDNKLDFASHSSSPNNAVRGVYLYLTRYGFDARTSSFARSDATKGLLDSTVFVTSPFAHLNDSLQRFSMLGAFRPLGNASRAIVFSGKGNGTDASYEAYFSAVDAGLSSGSILGRLAAVRDCTGDGWQDLIGSSSSWPGSYHSGIAVILAGGPYIPLDDPTVSVRTEPMANHQKGLYLWPNPATTELNLAWRGDLATMPTRFSIHDIAGKLITENEIRPEHGSARWSTAGVPTGTYLLTAYDRSGKVLASTQILVQH